MNNKVTVDQLKGNINDACGFFKTNPVANEILEKVANGCTSIELDAMIDAHRAQMNPEDLEFVKTHLQPNATPTANGDAPKKEEPNDGKKAGWFKRNWKWLAGAAIVVTAAGAAGWFLTGSDNGDVAEAAVE